MFNDETARLFYQAVCKNDIAKVQTEQNKRDHRTYYGASQLGKQCDREMFLNYRKAGDLMDVDAMDVVDTEVAGAKMRLFDRGHLEEDRFIQRIEPFFDKVWPVDPDSGKQWEVVNHEGMFKGHMDGKAFNLTINGVKYEGKFLLEFKTHGTKSFDKLAGTKRPDKTRPWGKKLKDVKADHYSQIQAYMFHDPELVGCLYLGVYKDTDEWYVEFIERDTEWAVSELQRVADVVWAKSVPKRMPKASATHFYCMHFCDYAEACFGMKSVRKTCRTCDAFKVEGSKNVCSAGVKSLDDGDMTPCADYKSIVLW